MSMNSPSSRVLAELERVAPAKPTPRTADPSPESGRAGSPEPAPQPVRLAYSAAHMVCDPAAAPGPAAERVDWAATLEDRRYLWSLGLGVAEAMDTAQRGALGWAGAAETLDRTLAEARRRRGAGLWAETVGGAAADALNTDDPTLAQITDEYIRQAAFIQSRGGTPMLMATAHLTRRGARPDDYVQVYTNAVRALEGPVFVHWLGEMFAPELAGYFPGDSFARVMAGNADKIRGVKLSLLDPAGEIRIRRMIRSSGQVVLTGDDFNYPELIIGGEGGAVEGVDCGGAGGHAGGAGRFELGGRSWPIGDFSHALLGIFDAIAPVAARALRELASGRRSEARELLGATRALGRKIFEAPTFHYKAGVIFLAYLNRRQAAFASLENIHRERSLEHYLEVFKLANECGALLDPADAKTRFAAWLEAEGKI